MKCEEIYQRVSQILYEALCLEPGEVVLTAMLHGDLGAQSIDFLDINFRLEREFGIKIPRGELFGDPFCQHDRSVKEVVKFIQAKQENMLAACSLGVTHHT